MQKIMIFTTLWCSDLQPWVAMSQTKSYIWTNIYIYTYNIESVEKLADPWNFEIDSIWAIYMKPNKSKTTETTKKTIKLKKTSHFIPTLHVTADLFLCVLTLFNDHTVLIYSPPLLWGDVWSDVFSSKLIEFMAERQQTSTNSLTK